MAEWTPASKEPLSLDPGFGKLGREVERFANHTRKMVIASQKHRALLEEASAWSEGAAPLSRTPEDPRLAMRAIHKFALGRAIRRPMLVGAYFAHHYLRIQAEVSRTLLRESFNPDGEHRISTCYRVYRQAEVVRRRWVSTLLEIAIGDAAPDLSTRDYAALNVGDLMDHEDVDLAMVARTAEARDALARAFAGISKTFLRYASKLQLFLTEELETPRVSALLEEYEDLLRRPGENVVSVMQLLGSQFLCGNESLRRTLDHRVIRAYYAGEGEPIVHEAFLRSVMAELRHYRAPATRPGVLSPKREVYVPAKLAITAIRVIHGVHEPRPPDALELVTRKDPELALTYRSLANAFVQNEILRSLMFLYVSHGDEFDLTDLEVDRATKRVALLMGARGSFRRTEAGRLAGLYTEIRARALRAVATLYSKIEVHLTRVSTFRRIVEQQTDAPNDNMVLRLLDALDRYRGSVFWDEVIELLTEERKHGSRFMDDFVVLPEETQQDVAIRLVALMCDYAPSLVEFLIYLAHQDRVRSARLPEGQSSPNAKLFWETTIAHLETEEVFEQFVDRLDSETNAEALYRLAVAFPAEALARFADLLEARETSTRGRRIVRVLRSAIVLVHRRSNYIGRIATRVLGRTPEFLNRLGDARRLRELSSDIVGQAARERVPHEQIQLLGDAFDVATLRAALIATLDGVPARLDPEFTAAVDQYVRELFKACFREVRDRSAMFRHYRPGSRIAILSTGGYGRGEAFGGDWDYLAVVDRNDKGLKKFFGKVLQRVAAAMTRRGLHPHNRFTQHFNAYVVSIPELESLLQVRGPETFVDEAEILESRFVLGDPTVARSFNARIRARIGSTHRVAFVRDVIGEIEARRDEELPGLQLKEAAGGLREIQLLWLVLRVFARLPGPFTLEQLPEVAERIPSCRADLRVLMVAHAELRRARELYRLVEAFDDNVDPEAIARSARDLPPLARAGVRDDFGKELEKLLSTSAKRIDRVVQAVRESLEQESEAA